MNHCPAHFYRYRSLSAGLGAVEYLEKTISHSEIFFSKPALFNDPFDCRPSFLFEASEKEMIDYYNRALKKHRPYFNREKRRREARLKSRDRERIPGSPEMIKRIQALHTEKIAEKIGVLCLSTGRDDILMWSHYADSHRGICLEFDGHSEFFARAHEVRYLSVRPKINPFRQSDVQMTESALLTKAKHWEYEQEWRLIEYTNGPGVYRFPSEALTGVVLGAQISADHKEKVIGWVAARDGPVKLYQSSPSDSSFSLNIEEVSLESL